MLKVKVVGASFHEDGRYFLTLTSCGVQHHTEVSDGRRYQPKAKQTISFPIGDDALDLELRVSATRIQALPELSPRGIMANSELEGSSSNGRGGWDSEVGASTLTLGQLLSMPQVAGGSAKHHEIELHPPNRGMPVGRVQLIWEMEDRLAEAHAAATRAAERAKAAALPPMQPERAEAFFPTAAAA